MAVAIKNLGYEKVVIYNGGLKDWMKSGLPTESIDPLPRYKGKWIGVEELKATLSNAMATNCLGADNKTMVTVIDFRSSLQLKERKGGDQYQIMTNCPIKTVLLDDFIDNKTLIESIPKEGLVVTISETGNRDTYLIRYLNKFGYTNVVGLQFGMRVWLKKDYPTKKVKSRLEE